MDPVNFKKTLEIVKQDATRFAKHYEDGRTRRAALAPYATAADALAFLRDPHVTDADRAPIAAAFVAEHRLGRSKVWTGLLFSVFEGMLMRIRATFNKQAALAGLSKREAAANKDLDQRVFLAFLEALVSPQFSPALPFISIERATRCALRVAKRREDGPIGDLSDEDAVPDTEPSYGIDPVELREVASILPDMPGMTDEMLDVICETIIGDELLPDYVARVHRGLDKASRDSIYDRLCRQRAEMIERINAHLTGRGFTTSLQAFASMPTL